MGGHNPRLLTTTANLQYVKKNFFLEIFLVSLRFYMNVDSCEKTESRSVQQKKIDDIGRQEFSCLEYHRKRRIYKQQPPSPHIGFLEGFFNVCVFLKLKISFVFICPNAAPHLLELWLWPVVSGFSDVFGLGYGKKCCIQNESTLFFLPNCGAALGRASKENTLGPFTVSPRARQDMAVAEKGRRGSDMLFVKILHSACNRCLMHNLSSLVPDRTWQNGGNLDVAILNS